MKIKTITDETNGKKWDIFKESENQYFYEYSEYYQNIGWRFISRDGDSKNGYYNKNAIEYEFDIIL